ncbi:hypothetical protein [Heliophilum fasciatum]|uniref:Uncharacterized protein n=1 Tax=Heliophilum fasciatum TaxID=35700 RepID=A0A4R2RX02_9FIRM|nr:hypothetical protein [Heliophilum fasciatum]MCW2277909.1 hypothetical protein [Heliophilum fasciatum]TCP64521.1 hypothetical protein EDD73_10962 [Heliophilum fasciatum]
MTSVAPQDEQLKVLIGKTVEQAEAYCSEWACSLRLTLTGTANEASDRIARIVQVYSSLDGEIHAIYAYFPAQLTISQRI